MTDKHFGELRKMIVATNPKNAERLKNKYWSNLTEAQKSITNTLRSSENQPS